MGKPLTVQITESVKNFPDQNSGAFFRKTFLSDYELKQFSSLHILHDAVSLLGFHSVVVHCVSFRSIGVDFHYVLVDKLLLSFKLIYKPVVSSVCKNSAASNDFENNRNPSLWAF